MELRFDLELSKRELLSIGQIVALWASLEYEIFYQTLKECAGSLDTLPRQGCSVLWLGARRPSLSAGYVA
jgi:hypothetical protein